MRRGSNLRPLRALTPQLERASAVWCQRLRLISQDDHTLHDICLTRFDAWREGNRVLFDLLGEIGAHKGSCLIQSSHKEKFMPARSVSPTRRQIIASSAAASAMSLLPGDLYAGTPDHAIRPFHINVPEEALIDLRRRLTATRLPERETVNDFSQGVQLGKLQSLVEYWRTDYDWRIAEARLNALPQFVTTIDFNSFTYGRRMRMPCR